MNLNFSLLLVDRSLDQHISIQMRAELLDLHRPSLNAVPSCARPLPRLSPSPLLPPNTPTSNAQRHRSFHYVDRSIRSLATASAF